MYLMRRMVLTMYESKYSKYTVINQNRFAEEEEILNDLTLINRGAGIPLYEKDGEVFVEDKDTNSMTIGLTGCSKSRGVAKTLIHSIINMKDCAIINDPKGELYNASAHLAYKNNIKVKVLNLRHPERSDGWNPLSIILQFYKAGNLEMANQLIDEFCDSIMSAVADEDDRLWDTGASAYLAAVIKIFLKIMPQPEYFTLANILQFASRTAEDDLKSIIQHCDLPHQVVSAITSITNLEAEKTKTCYYNVMSTGITNLIKNETLLKLLSRNDIDLKELGKEPIIIYVIYPDEQSSLDNVIKSFITQSYVALNWTCAEYPNNRLPICMNYVLDEFSNLAPIDKMDNRISECRSKGIRFHLFIQSMDQLAAKYSESTANTILSNTTTWICFSSKEIKFLKTISEICGEVTDWRGSTKPLITSSDIQHLKKEKESVQVLILKPGLYPYVTNLPYYDKCSFYSPGELNCNDLEVRCSTETDDHFYFTTSEWAQLVYEAYYNNISKRKRKNSDDEDSEELSIQEALERKFDELFGHIDED